MIYISINVALVCITRYGSLFLTNIGGGDNNIPFIITLVVFSTIIHGLLYLFIDHYRFERTDEKSSKLK